MKKIVYFICFILSAAICHGQIHCKNSTPVGKAAVFTELSDNGKPQKYLSLFFKGDSMDVKFDPGENCYLIDMDTSMKLTKSDLTVPVIKNYLPDPDQPVHFSVQKENDHCRAEYQFSYLHEETVKKFKLNIEYNSKKFMIDDSLQKQKPVILVVESRKKYLEVTAVYGSDWTYYFRYNLKDYESQLGEPLMHYTADIKKWILDNPKNPISDPIVRKFINDCNLSGQIKYTLTNCNDCP